MSNEVTFSKKDQITWFVYNFNGTVEGQIVQKRHNFLCIFQGHVHYEAPTSRVAKEWWKSRIEDQSDVSLHEMEDQNKKGSEGEEELQKAISERDIAIRDLQSALSEAKHTNKLLEDNLTKIKKTNHRYKRGMNEMQSRISNYVGSNMATLSGFKNDLKKFREYAEER